MMTHTLEKNLFFSSSCFARADSDEKRVSRDREKNLLRESRPYFTHKKMQSRIFTKNRPLKVLKIRRIERLFRTSVGILLARGRAFPFGVSVIPPRAPPPRTPPPPHVRQRARRAPAAPAVGRRAVLPSFRRAARAPRRARPPRAGAARSPSTPMSDSTSCSSARVRALLQDRRPRRRHGLAAQGASETSPSRTASTRVLRALTRARARLAPSRPNDKSANSAGVPPTVSTTSDTLDGASKSRVFRGAHPPP